MSLKAIVEASISKLKLWEAQANQQAQSLKVYRRYPLDKINLCCYPVQADTPIELQEFNMAYEEEVQPLVTNCNNSIQSLSGKEKEKIQKNTGALLQIIVEGLVESYRGKVSLKIYIVKLKLIMDFRKHLLGLLDLLQIQLQSQSIILCFTKIYTETKRIFKKDLIQDCVLIKKNTDSSQLMNLFLNKYRTPTDKMKCEDEIDDALIRLWTEFNILKYVLGKVREFQKFFPPRVFDLKFKPDSSKLQLISDRLKFCSIMMVNYDTLLTKCRDLNFDRRDDYAEELAQLKISLSELRSAKETYERCGLPWEQTVLHPLDQKWIKFFDGVKYRYYYQRHPSGRKMSSAEMKQTLDKELRDKAKSLNQTYPNDLWAFYLAPSGDFIETVCKANSIFRPIISAVVDGWSKNFYADAVFLNPSSFGFFGRTDMNRNDRVWLPQFYINYELSIAEIEFLSFHFSSEYINATYELKNDGEFYQIKRTKPSYPNCSVQLEVNLKNLIFKPPPRIYSSDEIYMLFCLSLLTVECSNYISAVLVGPQGDILQYAINTASVEFQCRHAEANLFWDNRYETLPDRFQCYTSLKSCWQCSGIMYHGLQKMNGKVFYEFIDSGNRAAGSCISSFESYLPLNLDSAEVLETYLQQEASAGTRQSARWDSFRTALNELSRLNSLSNPRLETVNALSHIKKFVRNRHSDKRLNHINTAFSTIFFVILENLKEFERT